MKRKTASMEKTCLVSVYLLFSLVFISIYPIVNCSATKTTIYVDDDGGADYTTIQEGINAASNGDTIYVYNGTYYENIVIKKTINLVGENKDITTIDGYSDELNLVIHISADNVEITGFTIRNSRDNYYCLGVILNNSNYNTIYNNTITICKDGIVICFAFDFCSGSQVWRMGESI